MTMLNGGPPLTAGNYRKYLENCDREMDRYRKYILGKHYDGLAACCQCYLDLYRGDPGCERPYTREGIWQITRSQVSAECCALGLDEKDYITDALS